MKYHQREQSRVEQNGIYDYIMNDAFKSWKLRRSTKR